MLAYAPRPARQRIHPATLTLILAGHAVAIFAVMSARMDVESRKDPPIIVDTIPVPPEPRPVEGDPPKSLPSERPLDAPLPLVPPPPLPGPLVSELPPPPDPGPLVGNGMGATPLPLPLEIVRTGPRFATPESDIRPPYPDSMRANEQEAVLKLRLAIDERGRVVAVEPVGRADPTFLAAARRHILKAWRYRPAMEGDKAVAATTVITLKFELD